jgi:hypothetical protein
LITGVDSVVVNNTFVNIYIFFSGYQLTFVNNYFVYSGYQITFAKEYTVYSGYQITFAKDYTVYSGYQITLVNNYTSTPITKITFANDICYNNRRYCEITFIRGLPIFVVFVGRLIHEIKNPTNNDTWEAV